jgi:hypothetical protein
MTASRQSADMSLMALNRGAVREQSPSPEEIRRRDPAGNEQIHQHSASYSAFQILILHSGR